VSTYIGIIDARHCIVEPHIFWNNALPHFVPPTIEGEGAMDIGKPGERIGFETKHPYCVNVQYPQVRFPCRRVDILIVNGYHAILLPPSQ
jgi:hypothetical protein